MTMTTDVALYGHPRSETDLRRQLVRDCDRVAVLLELLQDQLGQLRIDVAAPFGMGRPELVEDVDKATIAVTKLLTWAWDTAKVAARAPGDDARQNTAAEVTS